MAEQRQRLILVCGGTGKQGGATAFSLISKRQTVRVLTRTPEKARELERLGAEVVQGSFDDPESLARALRFEPMGILPAISHVDGVFLVSTFAEKGVEAEVAEAKAVIDACRKHKDIHIVFTSVAGANLGTGIPHFESKHEIEKHLKAGNNPWTILRPVFFMENFESPWMLPGIEKGTLRSPVRPDRRLQMISVKDVGEFAALAFLWPEEFVGKEIDLAADVLTMPEALEKISRVVGHPVRYEPVPVEEFASSLGEDMTRMYRWFNEKGYTVDIEGLKREYGIPPMTFEHYLDVYGLAGHRAAIEEPRRKAA